MKEQKGVGLGLGLHGQTHCVPCFNGNWVRQETSIKRAYFWNILAVLMNCGHWRQETTRKGLISETFLTVPMNCGRWCTCPLKNLDVNPGSRPKLFTKGVGLLRPIPFASFLRRPSEPGTRVKGLSRSPLASPRRVDLLSPHWSLAVRPCKNTPMTRRFLKRENEENFLSTFVSCELMLQHTKHVWQEDRPTRYFCVERLTPATAAAG